MIEMEAFLDGVQRGVNIGEKIREMLKSKGLRHADNLESDSGLITETQRH
jgi:hypothetical protein